MSTLTNHSKSNTPIDENREVKEKYVPYAKCDDINIYYETVGQGQPLVLGHGGSYTLDMWKDWGYSHSLINDFQLIMLDFRGHGRSDKVSQESASGSAYYQGF